MSDRNDQSEPPARRAGSPYDEPTSELSVPSGLRRVDDLDDIDPMELATTPLVVPSRSKLDRRPAGASVHDHGDEEKRGTADRSDAGAERADVGDDEPSARTSRIVKRSTPRTPTPITELGGEPELPLTTPLGGGPPAADYSADDSGQDDLRENHGSGYAATERFDADDEERSDLLRSDEPETEVLAADTGRVGPSRGELVDEIARARAEGRRGTLDVGLLLLRVAVGVIAVAHGTQKLFGWWNGPGLDGYEAFLAHSADPAIGFAPAAVHWLALAGAIVETGSGILLILGLLAPLAAAGLLGVMILACLYRTTLAGGFAFFAGDGIEYELLLAVCAAALVLTGPGRLALDARWGWTRRPMWGSIALLIVGIAGAVAMWIVFNGVNPLHPPHT